MVNENKEGALRGDILSSFVYLFALLHFMNVITCSCSVMRHAKAGRNSFIVSPYHFHFPMFHFHFSALFSDLAVFISCNFMQVNASAQFCGVAEMVGPVDNDKSVDYWKQDKWTGQFPVKWHIIKDVPNSQFRHIILENNDNKPVTNSRDTQEVSFIQDFPFII